MLNMGLWSKVKGVFGRIGHGIKSGWNWLTNNRDKIDGIQDVLQQYSDIIRKDSANASSESYAQKTAKFEKTVDDMVYFIDDAEAADDDDDSDNDDKNDEE